MKSERIKKFEKELKDLEEWLNLGLVPKNDIEKHKSEIQALKKRISDEGRRLKELKEGGDVEEFVTPKKREARSTYQEPQTMPGIEVESEGTTELGFENETEGFTQESTVAGESDDFTKYDDDEDPFSDKNRWKRGILEDPDADQW